MTQKRINIDEITIGKPLPWDVFDGQGLLLLRKGFVIDGEKKIAALIERGLFAEVTPHGSVTAPQKQTEATSVLRLINTVNNKLERALTGLGGAGDADFSSKILEIAKVILHSIKLNKSIAMAAILQNQHAEYHIRHCVDTAIVSTVVAQSLNYTNDDILKIVAACLTMNAGMIHDCKKFKSKPTLTSDEKKLVLLHPQNSVLTLERAGVADKDWLEYVLSHHEQDDGAGYPTGKTATELQPPLKIITMADTYCARISSREYKQAVLPNVALRDLFVERGRGVDAMVATTFVKHLGIYPPGTFVRLVNGEIGVVTQCGETAAAPVVHALVGPRGAPLSFAIKRDTKKESFAIKCAITCEEAAIRVGMQQVWGDQATL